MRAEVINSEFFQKRKEKRTKGQERPLKSGNSWFFVPGMYKQARGNKGYTAESNRVLLSTMRAARLHRTLRNQQDYLSAKSDHLRIVQAYDQRAYTMSEQVDYPRDIYDNPCDVSTSSLLMARLRVRDPPRNFSRPSPLLPCKSQRLQLLIRSRALFAPHETRTHSSIMPRNRARRGRVSRHDSEKRTHTRTRERAMAGRSKRTFNN